MYLVEACASVFVVLELAVIFLFYFRRLCSYFLSVLFFRLHLPQEFITQISTAMAASVWIFWGHSGHRHSPSPKVQQHQVSAIDLNQLTLNICCLASMCMFICLYGFFVISFCWIASDCVLESAYKASNVRAALNNSKLYIKKCLGNQFFMHIQGIFTWNFICQ